MGSIRPHLANQNSGEPMLEYGETQSELDVSAWTPEARNRLIQFFRILIEWEAARPYADETKCDDKANREHTGGSCDRGGLRPCLVKGPGA